MSISSQDFESYLPLYDFIPDDWEEAKPALVEQLKRISNAVNVREIGWYLDNELLSGKQMFPGTSSANDQQFRSIFRIVINFGALPNAATKSVAHNIPFNANFSLTHLYAGATDPVGFHALQIPYASPTLNENIKINIDATNVNITTAIDYSAYTRTFVVCEYISEV